MRPARVVAAALAVGVALAAAGEEPAAVRRLRLDLASLVRTQSAISRNELFLATGLFAALAADDAGLAATARNHLPDELENLEAGGRVAAGNAAGAALLVGGLATGDRRLCTGGLTLLEGNLLLGVTLDLAKSAFGRARPFAPHHGRFFRGGDSFPSSHAAHAFLIASVVDATAGRRWVRWTVYPLAGLVALSRLQEGVHHPTDVAAGAVLGWWIGSRLATAHHLRRRPHPRADVVVTPVAGGGAVFAVLRF